jgi:non-specific serine/threonine protein kinase
MIGETISHYKILEKIGEGGMGAVYAAQDASLNRKVALKVLPPEMANDPERLRRFEREAQAVAALNHPNIVTIYSVEDAEGSRFITMELVEGEGLDRMIQPGGMELERLFSIAIALTDALNAAHARGITHRDLKPANIVVTTEGRVKILDFGLAKLAVETFGAGAGDAASQTLTQEGVVVGTMPYMSPEQVQGRSVDHRTDVFALGVILYEMATGHRPFRGDTPADLISSILRDSPQPVSELNVEIPSHLGRVLKRCLEKSPDRRYQTALDIRNELEELQKESSLEEEPAIPSMAVLPFADLSAEKDQDYFCEGIAEEIINLLVKVDNLRVASRTSAFQIKDTISDIREIGEKLGVDTILGGSVRKSGKRLRITAQLINVADGYHIWSERYDRELEDVFEIQDEIAQSIVEALQVELSPTDRAGMQKKKRAETDVQAYDYYLRGRKAFWEFRKQGFEQARQMFARALIIDPNYARAYAGVADCCSFLYTNFESTTENLREADAASRRAIEIDPESAEAHASRGMALSLSRHYEEAGREFETAIRLDPKLFEAYYFYARSAFAQGNLDKAAEYFAKASELNREDYQALAFIGLAYGGLKREEEATRALKKTVAVIEKHLELHPDDTRALDLGAGVQARLGNREAALKWAAKASTIDPENPSVLYNVACTHAALGEIEQAIDYLEQSVSSGMAQVEWLENDPDLESLRDNERFKSLLKDIRESSTG